MIDPAEKALRDEQLFQKLAAELPTLMQTAAEAFAIVKCDGDFGLAVKKLCDIVFRIANHTTPTECVTIISHLRELTQSVELGYLLPDPANFHDDLLRKPHEKEH